MLHVCTMYAPSHNIAWEIMCTVFGILYHLLSGLLYFCCIVITVCCSHTYHLNETKRTMHPPFRVQRFNIARSKKWNRNYIFKNVNYGWTLTQSYKRSYTCISECDMHFCFGSITFKYWTLFNEHAFISKYRYHVKNFGYYILCTIHCQVLKSDATNNNFVVSYY